MIKYTFISTDGSKCDIVTISKDLLKNCTMSADAFDQLFFNELKTSHTHVEAYEKAEKFHYEYFEKFRYSDYDSFRKSKSQRLKK